MKVIFCKNNRRFVIVVVAKVNNQKSGFILVDMEVFHWSFNVYLKHVRPILKISQKNLKTMQTLFKTVLTKKSKNIPVGPTQPALITSRNNQNKNNVL